MSDNLGFKSPAAKLAAKLSAKICIEMGASLEYIEQELGKCKTLKQFKVARTRIQDYSVAQTMNVAKLTLEMAQDGIKLQSETKRRKIEETLK
jgi:hypothetical protein